MCGRLVGGHLTQAQMLAILEGFLYGAPVPDADAPEARSGWNIKPTQRIHMICQDTEAFIATSARWWFVPHWFKGDVKDWKQTTFNARIETAAEKPTFRTAWKSSRCIIPAVGYYEWSGPKNDRKPNFITLEKNAPLIFFAGLCSTLQDGTRTCTILTREPAAQIAHIHTRMPVILKQDELTPWINNEMETTAAQEALGTGWEGRFKFHEVNRFGRDDDDPELIEPIDRLL
ncbi:SOS response-associated peptidase [uncultured Roseobacter sp.]|uniref:SOS response-associated peptidase n=1 Tax=uncultured Roseobacter sp. TaxID=114847 RepID=UPI0026292E0A|nr:SOS response-associated peptidase [uncultured Roseobacter sp.]